MPSHVSAPAALADRARSLDAADPLRSFRDRFRLPAGKIYMDGNSLGACSVDAEEGLAAAFASWRDLGIEGWTEASPPWFTMAEELGALAAGLVGARPHEVVVTNSTTVNLHQLLATFHRPVGRRTRILADALAFPSDLYAIASHLRSRGMDPAREMVTPGDRARDRTIDEDRIIAAMTDEVAFAVLPGVLFTTGQLLDMERISAAARERGVFLAWDLSHAVGSVPHRLHDWGADAAFWCSYKYLNGGPGAPGGLFVHDRRFPPELKDASRAAERLAPGLAGWFSSDKAAQFRMDGTLVPAWGAGAFQIGTPSVLAMGPLLGSLRVLREAGMDRIRAKSLAMTRFLMDAAAATIDPSHGVAFANPREDARRGGHVALTLPDPARAQRLAIALRDVGVVPDFRHPDIVRLAPVALYNTFEECLTTVLRIRDLLDAPADWESLPLGSGVS